MNTAELLRLATAPAGLSALGTLLVAAFMAVLPLRGGNGQHAGEIGRAHV